MKISYENFLLERKSGAYLVPPLSGADLVVHLGVPLHGRDDPGVKEGENQDWDYSCSEE